MAATEEPILIERICKRLPVARQIKGWNQQELSHRSGVPQSQISKLESNHVQDPSIATIIKLVNTLGIDLAVFINPSSELFLECLAEEIPLDELDYNSQEKQAVDHLENTKQIKGGTFRPISNPQGSLASQINVVRSADKSSETPIESNEQITLGWDDNKNQEVTIGMSELNRHLLATGQQQTGKSKWLNRVFLDIAAKQDRRLILFADEMADQAFQSLPSETKISYLDFTDQDSIVRFNPLDCQQNAINQVVFFYLQLLRNYSRLRPGFQSDYALNYARDILTVLAYLNSNILTNETKCSLFDIEQFLFDVEFRELALFACPNKSIFNRYLDQPTDLRSKPEFESLLMLLDDLNNHLEQSPMLRSLIGPGLNTGGLEDIIIIKTTSQTYLDNYLQTLITDYLLQQIYYDTANSAANNRPTRVLIDDLQKISSTSYLPVVLEQGRINDIGVIATSNSNEAAFTGNTKLLNALRVNMGSRICFTQTAFENKAANRALRFNRNNDELYLLPDHHAIGSLLAPSTSKKSDLCSLKTDYQSIVNCNNRQQDYPQSIYQNEQPDITTIAENRKKQIIDKLQIDHHSFL